MAKWELIHEIVNNLGRGWEVDASGPQKVGCSRAIISGPGGMRLYFCGEWQPWSDIKDKEPGWLHVEGRFPHLGERVHADISVKVPESLTAEEIANEIILRLLPLYSGFLCVVEKHNDERGAKS